MLQLHLFFFFHFGLCSRLSISCSLDDSCFVAFGSTKIILTFHIDFLWIFSGITGNLIGAQISFKKKKKLTFFIISEKWSVILMNFSLFKILSIHFLLSATFSAWSGAFFSFWNRKVPTRVNDTKKIMAVALFHHSRDILVQWMNVSFTILR